MNVLEIDSKNIEVFENKINLAPQNVEKTNSRVNTRVSRGLQYPARKIQFDAR